MEVPGVGGELQSRKSGLTKLKSKGQVCDMSLEVDGQEGLQNKAMRTKW